MSVAKVSEISATSAKSFEDAIQHFSAKAVTGISTIVTRYKADYSASEIPILSAAEYLADD